MSIPNRDNLPTVRIGLQEFLVERCSVEAPVEPLSGNLTITFVVAPAPMPPRLDLMLESAPGWGGTAQPGGSS